MSKRAKRENEFRALLEEERISWYGTPEEDRAHTVPALAYQEPEDPAYFDDEVWDDDEAEFRADCGCAEEVTPAFDRSRVRILGEDGN